MRTKDFGIKVEDGLLPQYAENEARGLTVQGTVSAVRTARWTTAALRNIQRTALRLSDWGSAHTGAPPEFEWLLDNRYLLEREARESILVLRQVGKLPAETHQGLPVSYELARRLVRAGQNAVTAERLALYLEGAQKVRPLSEKELALFVPLLKAALVESVASLCGEMEEMLSGYTGKNPDNPYAAERAVRRALEEGSPPHERAEALSRAAAAAHIRLSGLTGRAVTSLRLLASADLTELLQKASVVERILRQDPVEVYPAMDEASRAWYRQELSRLARRRRITEVKAAETALALARKGSDSRRRHVGYYILNLPLGRRKSAWGGRWYFLAQALLTVLFAAAAGLLSGHTGVAALLLFPAFDLAKNIVDFTTVRLTRPRHIPRLELCGGLPAHGATLCVISALLTDSARAKKYVKLLENYKIANRDAGNRLVFGLLADLPDAPVKRRPRDKQVIESVQKAIFELNRRHGGGFFLFMRDRQFNMRDKVYMGWERKRGALLELMCSLRGRETGLRTVIGDPAMLRKIKYLITLDADTRLTAGSARELVGAMMHPLTVADVDPIRRVVVEGHAVLQPRMAIDLVSAGKTTFSRIYAGQGGLDPYGGASSDVYQDLFDRGVFSGKGIFDVDVFLTCLEGRFPENKVLSHDLLEGCYLRAGLLGDVELADGYPCKAASWFDRLHRWTRGDWQIAGWLRRKVKTGGQRERNPLDALSRWKIFDNLRRSLSPVFMLAALTLGFAASIRPLVLAAGFAVLCAASNLLLSAAEMAVRGGGGARYHSTIITGVTGTLLQCVLQLLFLPYMAFVSLHAALTALWRILFSKKYLLRWVTAAESERGTETGVWYHARKMFPSILWGVLCATLSPTGWVVGVFWALAPVVASGISRPRHLVSHMPGEDRAFLVRQAALIWQYFEDFLTPEDHFLPPDNWQEQPAVGIAHRTSPTNIGLGLLCALAALDLKMVGADRALRLIDKMLETLENLPKWHGHIYNWYDTQTLEPLRPRYVSTVDSGNLACSLIALREGLSEQRDAAAEDLAARADRLSRCMEFARLYDSRRRLFYIGFDLESGQPSDSYYDLLASEARQTSFLAVARGEVERRHWRRLGRALVSDDRYSGMASWTGTMFEYLMPHLLMPCFENSLLYESARFCVYCHRKRGATQGIPWGISESCFYAFDNALNYQYKAHGIPRLAFKRGMGLESVVAPYAGYLALPVAAQSAVKNLRRLRDIGMEGRYGLFEAADFTPARQTGNGGVEMVRCFMSHHIGMSLLAIVNALHDNIMQKRFMRDPEMGSFAELLQEKVPVGAVSVRPFGREVPDKPARLSAEGYRLSGQARVSETPVCHVLSNASYTLYCDDAGRSASYANGLALNRFSFRTDHRAGGMVFAVHDGHSAMGLTPAPWGDKTVKYGYEFTAGAAIWTAETQGLQAEIDLRVPDNEMGEWRSVTLKNTDDRPRVFTLACYFEPVLARRQDYEAHPAFSKLFLETEIREQTVVVRRRPRGGDRGVFLAFTCDHPGVGYDTARETLGRGGMNRLAEVMARPPCGTAGGVLDPCVLARIPLELLPGDTVTVRFALSSAGTAADAVAAAVRTVNMPVESGRPGRLAGLLRLLGLTNAEAASAFDILRALVFPTDHCDGEAVRRNTMGQNGLWKFGVSGDLPVMLFDCVDKTLTERLVRLIRQHRMLSLCGVACDLLVLTRDGSDYRRPMRGVVDETLKAIGAERLVGARGGVHVIDLSACPPEEETLLRAAADWRYQSPDADAETAKPSLTRPKRLKPNTASSCQDGQSPPVCRYLPDGAVQFDTSNGLPHGAWSHVLANPAFGVLVTDTGAGYMWRLNARENKMTPWTNDPLAVEGGEQIILQANEKTLSLFAGADGVGTRITYGFGYARWEKETDGLRVVTTAFVPPDRMARVLMVEVEGACNARLCYHSELLLGADASGRRHVTVEQTDDGLIRVQNRYNTDFSPQIYAIAASVRPEEAAFVPGEVGFNLPMHRAGAVLRAVLVCGCGCNEPGLSLLCGLTDWTHAEQRLRDTEHWWSTRVRPLRVETPDPVLDAYLNGWALYQVQAGRLCARTSVYQCGGAFGFRDQLQDVCALLYGDPAAVRRHILRACAHQFEEGDVQHWWHVTSGRAGEGERGVRTRCSDDLLWLPYVVCEYLDKTGDEGILSSGIPYIQSPVLREDEDERYETPRRSALCESVYAHCLRAIDRVLARGSGAHGLLLMGGGDWNDGFNLVGAQGSGESTWLTWFCSHVLDRFSRVCRQMGEEERAERFARTADGLTESAARAWDGEWYLRGYYDDGATLGSHRDEECQIDSIAQSFAQLARHPRGDAADFCDRNERALKSALDRLVDREHRIVRLFDPAFESSPQNPGYIKGYLAGVRENGGQYTHASVWLALGCLLAGQCDEGYEILNLLLPGTHDPNVYRAEPYVLAADVYYNERHRGRGGWSGYTGAAAWYYRTAVEQLLGICWQNGVAAVTPRLPSEWDSYVLTVGNGPRQMIPREGSRYRIPPEWVDQKGFTIAGKV